MTTTKRPKREVAVQAAIAAWCGVGRAAAWLLPPLMTLQFLSGYALMHPWFLGGVMERATAFRVACGHPAGDGGRVRAAWLPVDSAEPGETANRQSKA